MLKDPFSCAFFAPPLLCKTPKNIVNYDQKILYVLDLKESMTKLNDELKGIEETFYRYRIVDDANNDLAIAWFTQKVDTGHIYCTSCRTLANKVEKFGIFFEIPLDGPYKPSSYYIKLPYEYVTQENYKALQTGTEMSKNIADCIMTIFEDSEHKRGGHYD